MSSYAPPIAVPARSLRVPPFLRSFLSLFGEISRDRFALLAAIMLGIVVLLAIFAPLVAPFDPNDKEILQRLKPPIWMEGSKAGYILGTDQLGRDILSRLIYGARASVTVGVSVVLFSGIIGNLVGMISGFFGGWVDQLIMRLVDVQVAFPGLIISLVILTVVGPSIGTVIVALGSNGWMVYARMARGQVLTLREQPFVEAAIAAGCKPGRVILRHVLPNLASPIITLTTLELARIILAEAILSFLGLGVQPPDTSWGLMMSDGRNYLDTAWWVSTFPGIAVAFTVLSVNVLASWFRTIADPTQRFRAGMSSV
jgi:peptide/nickel transport system permease protein